MLLLYTCMVVVALGRVKLREVGDKPSRDYHRYCVATPPLRRASKFLVPTVSDPRLLAPLVNSTSLSGRVRAYRRFGG